MDGHEYISNTPLRPRVQHGSNRQLKPAKHFRVMGVLSCSLEAREWWHDLGARFRLISKRMLD